MVNANLKDSSDLAVLLDQRGMDWLVSQDFGDVWFFQSRRGTESGDIYVRAHVEPNLHLVVRWDGEEWMPEGVLTLEEFQDSVETLTVPVPWLDAAREIGEAPVKDDPEMAQFEGGGQRSSDDGKPDFSLLLVSDMPYEDQLLYHAGLRMQEGAKVYGRLNHEQMNTKDALDRCNASLLRHVMQYLSGEKDENHLAAVVCNAVMASGIRSRMSDGNDR